MTSNSRLDIIQIDTREKKNGFIEQQLQELGIPYYRSKMYVGDYQFISNPFFVIDRKKGMEELYSNVTTDHGRFRRELMNAQASNIHMVVLVEEESIKTLEDVKMWKNPQKAYHPKAKDGAQIYKTLDTLSWKYEVEFKFATHDQYADCLISLLREAQDKWLKGVSDVWK